MKITTLHPTNASIPVRLMVIFSLQRRDDLIPQRQRNYGENFAFSKGLTSPAYTLTLSSMLSSNVSNQILGGAETPSVILHSGIWNSYSSLHFDIWTFDMFYLINSREK